jgi:hypothetical protein
VYLEEANVGPRLENRPQVLGFEPDTGPGGHLDARSTRRGNV